MSNNWGQQGSEPPQWLPGPTPPPRTKPARWRRGWAIAAYVVAAFGIGAAAGAGGSSDPAPAAAAGQKSTPTVTVTAAAKPAPTVTVTAAPPADSTSDDTASSSGSFNPKPRDFVVKVKIKRKACFGSAGCNVDYRIDPDYIGSQGFPDSGETEVTYKVTGGEDGPMINTFTVDSEGTAHFDEEESTSTDSSGAVLKATVTEVTYDPNG